MALINNVDAVKIVEAHRGDALIVTTMSAGNLRFGLPAVTQHDELDVPLSGCMGKASSIGLGIALARPERKVMVLDGDGSLLMNLGSLVTVGNKAPENLYHFVFENGVYAVTGGQPIPGEGNLSFQGLAKEAGYAEAYEFDATEEFATNIGEILQKRSPVLVCLKVVPEIENVPIQFRQRPSRNMKTAIRDMARLFGR